MSDYFEILFKNKIYKISYNKIYVIFCALEGSKVDINSPHKIIKLFRKYNLLNREFLRKISEI